MVTIYQLIKAGLLAKTIGLKQLFIRAALASVGARTILSAWTCGRADSGSRTVTIAARTPRQIWVGVFSVGGRAFSLAIGG